MSDLTFFIWAFLINFLEWQAERLPGGQYGNGKNKKSLGTIETYFSSVLSRGGFVSIVFVTEYSYRSHLKGRTLILLGLCVYMCVLVLMQLAVYSYRGEQSKYFPVFD